MFDAPSDQAEADGFWEYMRDGFDGIEGWPGQKRSVLFMSVFRPLFSAGGPCGGTCEIGVHHGKYLIALHNLMPERRSLAIDIFDDQAKNFDNSGKGSLAIFNDNVGKFAVRPENIAVLSKDSLALTDGDITAIIQKSGQFALFSIDGGHTALHMVNDFQTASKLTSPSGLIIVDDLFHPDWPGVTEGLYDALSARHSPFVPLFITRKKIYLCHISVFNRYKEFVINSYREFDSRDARLVEFFGWNIPSLDFGTEY